MHVPRPAGRLDTQVIHTHQGHPGRGDSLSSFDTDGSELGVELDPRDAPPGVLGLEQQPRARLERIGAKRTCVNLLAFNLQDLAGAEARLERDRLDVAGSGL